MAFAERVRRRSLPSELSSCQFAGVPKAFQRSFTDVALVALDFYGVVFNRTADATFLLEPFGNTFQLFGCNSQSLDYSDRFSAATFGLTLDSNDAISQVCRSICSANATGYASKTLWTKAPLIGAVNWSCFLF